MSIDTNMLVCKQMLWEMCDWCSRQGYIWMHMSYILLILKIFEIQKQKKRVTHLKTIHTIKRFNSQSFKTICQWNYYIFSYDWC